MNNEREHIDRVRRHYAKMSDEKLEQIAMYEIRSLEGFAKEIAELEIRKRGLDNSIFVAVEVQNQAASVEEILQILEKLSMLPCPRCGQYKNELCAGIARKVISMIVFTNRESSIVYGCFGCVKKAINNDLIYTVSLGWWALPWGFVYTIRAIYDTIKEARNFDLFSIGILSEFVKANIGAIKRYWDDDTELRNLLR